MSVTQLLDNLFASKDIPITKEITAENLALYTVSFHLNDKHALRLEVLCENEVERTDVQLTYRFVAFLNRYEKKDELLTLLNDLNEYKSGYFTFYLAQDGEVYLKNVTRVSDDIQSLYETLIQGPEVVRLCLRDIETITGQFEGFATE